ncbi:DMT family transporter [Cellulosimicrobium cellulans]|uniref:DMT family transporter n=1 Tax=Cellulosimicrobium cellulans TaxID=1710 RepID=UPI0016529D0B|nr:SMR family transporter [Cellulosimicrobium cellulans]
MNAWIALAGAIVFEVLATIALRIAVTSSKAWYFAVAVGYLAAFVALAVTLQLGLQLGVAYGVWAACGVGLTAVAGRMLFRERLSRLTALGIVLTVLGVLLIESGAPV